MNGFDKNTWLLEGLEVGQCRRWPQASLVAGMDSFPVVDQELRSNGGFQYRRIHTPDPEQPLVFAVMRVRVRVRARVRSGSHFGTGLGTTDGGIRRGLVRGCRSGANSGPTRTLTVSL
jgi:hypothetical protein